MTSVKSTQNSDECVELKNIKYQTMLLNNKTDLAPNNIDNISNIDSFLDNEKKTNEKKPWSKLSSALKLKKIQVFVEKYAIENEYNLLKKNNLFIYLNTQLQRKKLQRMKDVIYDPEKGIIKDIIGLTYNKTNLKFITGLQAGPDQVPNIDKHTFPFSYKLGLNLTLPSIVKNFTSGGLFG